MRFYLGSHEPCWLGRTDVPLFYSRNRLARQKSWPRARGPWALDSAGYSQLTIHGRYTFTPEQYVAEVRRWRDEIGNLEWAASMDYMCEPQARAKTGLHVDQHQRKTIENFLRLRDLAPEIAWVPVLQGQTIADYWYHLDSWEASGVELAKVPVVGVGSICRLQATDQVRVLLATLRASGLRLHGFGLKRTAFKSGGVAFCLDSADSLAWSTNARKSRKDTKKLVTGCAHGKDGKGSCANCMTYALAWRAVMLQRIEAATPWDWQKKIDYAAMEDRRSYLADAGIPAEEDALLRYIPRFLTLASMLFAARPERVEPQGIFGAETRHYSLRQLGLPTDWALTSGGAVGGPFEFPLELPLGRDFRPGATP